jgi:hypothetical protein
MGYYYSDGGRYEGAGREPSFSAQIVSGTNPMWISPLSTDEIKACLQLLARLGPDSSLSTDGVTVHFSRSLMDPDRLHTYVNIDFYRKGFLRANYTTEIPAATEVPTTEEFSKTDNKKSGISDQRATKPPSGAGHITFVTAETQKQHIAKFHTLLPQVLQAASAKRLTPSQAREQLYALYIEESQSFKWNLFLQNRDYRAQVDQVDPSIYPGMVSDRNG